MPNGTIRIARLFGIDIELHWLFIALILFFFYLSALPGSNPLGGVIWVLLFVCVLIHELAHSVTAQGNGVKVSRIILLPIGGASIIDQTDIDPKTELNISIVGPITSFLLGGFFGILLMFTTPGTLQFLLEYLFKINIILGIFNILPAFPMDGGRVLKSYLETRYDEFRATMITVKVSKYCLALIVIAAFIYAIAPLPSDPGSRQFTLIWTVLIAFFLYQGAIAQQESIMLKRETKGITVGRTVTTNYMLVEYNSRPSSLYMLLNSKKEHIILTKTPQGFAMVDIFSPERLKKARSIKDLLIETPNLQESTPIADAMARLESNPYRVGAVLKGGRLLGVATGNHISAFIALHTMKGR